MIKTLIKPFFIIMLFVGFSGTENAVTSSSTTNSFPPTYTEDTLYMLDIVRMRDSLAIDALQKSMKHYTLSPIEE